MNPRRRRRRRHHSRPRYSHRRRYRRNPAGGLMGDVKAIVPAVGWGVVGATGSTLVPGLVGKFVPLPTKDTNPAMYYGVKFLSAIGLGWLAGMMVGRTAGRHIMTGGAITVAAEAVNHFALAPAGLATYLPDTVSDVETYLPGSEPMGYLSPGTTVDDYEDTGITRLDPNRRF